MYGTDLSSFKFFCWVAKNHFISARVTFQLFKAIQLKAHMDFLLVCNSNLSLIFHRFGDMTAFMYSWPHPYSTVILGVFSLHQTAHVGVDVSRDLKLFGREIIFLVFQTVWKTYLNVTDRRTDEQTDRQTTYNLITTLCVASRCKKQSIE